MQHHALDERAELAATLHATPATAPTLCGEWSAGQLATHLVLRERSLTELGGRLPVAALRRRAESAIDAHLGAVGYLTVIEQVESGPPRWSPLAVPALREAVNLVEYAIHHEDVRRAAAGWEPRSVPIDRQQAIWSRLKLIAPLTLRAVPIGIELVWPSHGSIATRRARRGPTAVRIMGDPVELALVAFGRQRVAQVDYDGAAADIAAARDATIAI